MSDALAEARASDSMVAEARASLQNGRVADAADLCQQVLKDEPKNKDALYTLAVAGRLQKKFDEALALGRPAVAAWLALARTTPMHS